ncbi:FadR/GntR family transcriptional regulator [Xylophilus sp. ASV27]|uniref:FadR/GntR family transcriptional regulator n=1 Tax=Xylophilus sp. ASV27 TaxID=2795129 RepID=UPI001E610B7C|nr:FadR/GntR family transcriptional regulator [Xylophilus sp. ASV27]
MLRNFHEQMVEALGSKIVAGGYAEGEQLPTEPQLAEAYGASRMIIREAMKSLSAKGLVSIRPRTGTRVQPRTQWNLFDPSVLGWHSAARFDRKLIADLMELRRAIEPLAARLAAERGAPEAIDALRTAYLAMAAAGERDDYIEADLRFHGAVVRGCGNQFILQLENALSAVWKTSFRASSDPWGPDTQALALHKTLLDAIEGHDGPAAEAAVLALIERATVRIQEVSATGSKPVQ